MNTKIYLTFVLCLVTIYLLFQAIPYGISYPSDEVVTISFLAIPAVLLIFVSLIRKLWGKNEKAS